MTNQLEAVRRLEREYGVKYFVMRDGSGCYPATHLVFRPRHIDTTDTAAGVILRLGDRVTWYITDDMGRRLVSGHEPIFDVPGSVFGAYRRAIEALDAYGDVQRIHVGEDCWVG